MLPANAPKCSHHWLSINERVIHLECERKCLSTYEQPVIQALGKNGYFRFTHPKREVGLLFYVRVTK